MGLLCMLKGLKGSRSSILRRSYSCMAGGKIFLEDIKHSGTLEEKKFCSGYPRGNDVKDEDWRSKWHAAILSRHPHLQTKIEETQYIQSAYFQLKQIGNGKLFPIAGRDQHQVPIVSTSTRQLYSWKDVYSTVCIMRRNVNISDYIKGASQGFHEVYKFRSIHKISNYDDVDLEDELRYYINVIKHMDEHPDLNVDTLHDHFPTNTTEMFRFHYAYDGHAMGAVDITKAT